MIEELTTENLILRKAKDSDLESILAGVWSDEKIARTMLWKPTKTEEEAMERMERTIAYQADNHAFFVCLKKTDEAIGFAGIREAGDRVYEESGICIARAHQKKGYGKEVLQTLIDLAFNRLQGKEFIYGCFHENRASAALCRSLGFVYSHSETMRRDWDGYEYVCDFYVLKKTEDKHVNQKHTD